MFTEHKLKSRVEELRAKVERPSANVFEQMDDRTQRYRPANDYDARPVEEILDY